MKLKNTNLCTYSLENENNDNLIRNSQQHDLMALHNTTLKMKIPAVLLNFLRHNQMHSVSCKIP
jgi:hypothetical protein